MPKRGNSPDAILERLTALRQVSSSPEFLAELRKAVGHTSPVVVMRGIELAGRYNRAELIDDLVAAYDRCRTGVVVDRQHTLQTAIVRGLIELSATSTAAEGVYLAGARTIGARIPPSNPDDFAADLRASSAHGLVMSRHPDAPAICCDLLADASPIVRAGAARALSAGGYPAAPLLLRLVLRRGDPSPEVLAECATELVGLDPAAGLDPVADLLDHDSEPVRAAAALALGSPRVPGALDRLKRSYAGEEDADVRQAILVAAAATRSADAVDWLIELVRSSPVARAVVAIEALAPYRADESVVRRLTEIAETRKDAKLTDAIRAAFGK